MSGVPSDATIWTRERRYFFTSRSHSTNTTAMRSSPPHAGDLTHLVCGGGALVPDRRAGEAQERRLQRVGGGLLLSLRGRGRGGGAPVGGGRRAIRPPGRLVPGVGGGGHRCPLPAPQGAHRG